MARNATAKAAAKKTIGKDMKTAKASNAAATNADVTITTTKGLVRNWMDENPGLVLALWGQICAGLIVAASPTAAPGDESRWPETYIYWRQVPKYWLAQLIATVAKDHGVSEEMLDKLDGKGGEQIRRISQLIFGIAPNQKIPKQLLDKPLMTGWLEERSVWLGRRYAQLAAAISGESVLDWAQVGAFKFLRAEGGGFSVSHCILGVAPMPSSINFSNGDWDVQNSWDDMAACLQSDVTQTPLKNLFKQSQGYEAFFGNLGQKSMIESAAEYKEKVTAAAPKRVVDKPEVLKTLRGKQRTERLAKAKAARVPTRGVKIPKELLS